MDIQGYIIDHWKQKMKPEQPVLIIYDAEGTYYDLLPLAAENGIKVVDTTKGFLHARLSASRYWCGELDLDSDSRMIVYRRAPQPRNNREWVEEPFAAFKNSAALFPVGPQDEYKNLCHAFLPTKGKELDEMFKAGSTSFNMVNALLDGAAYPELEQLTGGKSFAEMTVGLLAQSTCADMKWLQEWKRFAEIQYPGLETNVITLSEAQWKLWTYLLFSEFVFDLPTALPGELKSIPMAPKEMQEKIYMVCDKLRNQVNLRDLYVRMARKITEALHLDEHFARAKHLGDRVTFRFENGVEYERFINYLKEGKTLEAQKMFEKNQNDVWAQEDTEVATFWNLAKQGLRLVDCIHRGIKSDGTLKDLVDWYAESGCEADGAFRKFMTDQETAINLPKAVKGLKEYVITVYREFTERGVKPYQEKILELKDDGTLRNQGAVEKVYPALRNGKRVVFVMVDAFRYEMAKTFCKSLESSYPERITCEPRVSVLPSITRFGMANHLGDIKMVEEDGKLMPKIDDDIIALPDDRIAYMRQHTGAEVQDIRLQDWDMNDVNDNTQLLVVRSTDIDAAGENLNGLPDMERELIRLAHVLDDCRRLKFDEAILVADHGFMLQPSFRDGDLIQKPAGSDIIVTESRMLAGNLNDSPDTLSFTPKQLGVDAEVMKFCYAKAFTVFSRGDVYYHEGLSLQENIVPMVSVKLQQQKERSKFNLELKYKGETSGTVYSRRPMVDINIYNDSFFADDVNVKLIVTGIDGSEVGRPNGKFFNELTNTLNIQNGVEKARQTLIIDDEYHGDTLVVTALDPDTNATLSTLKLNFEND